MLTIVHLHLVLNHLPILLTALALALLAVAAWQRSDFLARMALIFLIGGAISGLATYLTGEGAEEAVENLPDVTERLIEQHEDTALVAAIVVGALGVFALWGLWRFRRPVLLPRWVVWAMLAGSLVGSGLMAYTGLQGGQIRHTEVRPGFVPPGSDDS